MAVETDSSDTFIHKMMTTDTIVRPDRPGSGFACFIRVLLRGAGQVMFQRSAWTGALFLAGICWGAWQHGAYPVIWGALTGLTVSTGTSYLLGLPAREGEQGLWGFNGLLAGCAFPTFMGNTPWMWLALVLCAALTTWVRTGLDRIMAPWKISSLTFPFVLCTWFFLLAARSMHGMPPSHMSAPELPGPFLPAEPLQAGRLAAAWLKGIGQVFLIDSWGTGLLFLAGLFVGDRRAALWAAVGSALGTGIALLFGAPEYDIVHGLYGFGPALTAIALATVFHKPGLRSSAWALLGIAVTVFVQAGMNTMTAPVGISSLTAPFCIATWLFLLPLFRFDDTAKPDHSNWDVRNKRHLARPGDRRNR